ncbi:thioredoxin [Catalinimonas niigatensis]|uniref:thioredoxin n=1 Tax=Catalinimonas niigatensis TaxID=1397264 RepID=UPI0026670014|nr:thioredoxin [Catalinimonas niigatensis]WPP49712.1 thioredoxin [Catalinimonas niigatensis]
MENTIKFQDLIRGKKPLLVDFYASWCSPCKMMQPVLQELVSMVGNEVKVIKIDVEKNPQIARSLRIQGVPTLILFQQGEILWRQSGLVSAQHLAQVIQKHSKKIPV